MSMESEPLIQSSELLIESRLFNFILWILIFVAVYSAVYFLIKKRKPEYSLAILNSQFGPLLIALFWFYGLFFHPPNNFSVIKKYGFFKFWFRPNSFSDMFEHILLVTFLLVVGIILFIYAYRIMKKYSAISKGTLMPLIALFSWYFAGFCLRYLPDTTLEVFMYYASPKIGTLFALPQMQTPFVLGILLASIAHFLTMRSAKSTIK